MLGINGNFVFSTVPVGQKIQALAQILYGYGYITPFAFEYENPRLKCSRSDFLAALEEYEFLDNPDPDTPVALVTIHTSCLNDVTLKGGEGFTIYRNFETSYEAVSKQ